MRTFRDAKVIAKALSDVLARKEIRIGHSESLEIVARQFGFENWNVLASKLTDDPPEKAIHNLPEGWGAAGSRPDFYDMGVEKTGGGAIAFIRRRPETEGLDDAAKPFGTMMQSIEANTFIGGKVRFSAWLRTEAVISAATIWLRIDDERGSVRFDNMEYREEDGAVRRTSGWVHRSIVLDVPEAAQSVHFGFYLRGRGVAFARDFLLETVDDSVPVSAGELKQPNAVAAKSLLLRPTNLGLT
jgi:hypothetical protein